MKYDNETTDKVDYNEEELQSVLKSELDDARDYIDQIGEERAESTQYYLGDSPSGGSDISSEYVSTDVRDSVLFMLPSVMRTFFGTNKVVEFVPTNIEDIPVAKQQTDYINYIVTQKNSGFKVMYDVFKDALIRKSGFVKAFYDQSLKSTTHEYTDLTPQEYEVLIMDEDVEVVSAKEITEQVMIFDEATQQEVANEQTIGYDLKIRRVKANNQLVIESVPPEEILMSRNARSFNESPYVAHRKICTVSDLVSMGYDREEIEEFAGTNELTDAFDEEQSRNPYADLSDPDRQDGKEILYIEHYIHYDKDDDGIDELLKVCTVGNGLEIINCEAIDEIPVVMFCPDPEPHTAIGSCPADYLKPIQDVKSQIVRDSLDSLGHSIFPRMGVVEGQVNIDDVLNNDIGQPIRMRQAGAVQPFSVPFAGKEAFPFLQYLDEQKENRTGVSKAAAGLNADALQSSTKAAVSSTMSAAQGRIELICRHFAEGMKELFGLLNNLVIKNSEEADIVRLNNEFVAVDPRYWDLDKDLICNVGISKSSDDEKLNVLNQVATKQEMILQTLGPVNPLVTGQQYVNTLTKIIELAGFSDPSQFFNPDVPEQQVEPEDSKPSAEEQLAIAETMKAEVQAEKLKVDAETDRMKIIMNDDIERDKFEVETRLKMAELYAKYGNNSVSMDEISKIMERDNDEFRNAQKIQATGLFSDRQEDMVEEQMPPQPMPQPPMSGPEMPMDMPLPQGLINGQMQGDENT
tara:strand:- start:6593 stop:8830 length:2238 start_codon:yes stop_codon:yes gene_type:complete